MKSLTLALVVALGLSGTGCAADEEEAPPPVEAPATRLASSLERTLAAPIAIPAGTPVGTWIDDVVAAHPELTAQPVVKIGANGQRCETVKYVDEKGTEQMRRDRCSKATDRLTVGSLLYMDENADGKIDQFADGGAASYELFDDDYDGKVDRMIESLEHIATPISLSDFASDVTITNGGKIAKRVREDKNHDGKFDVESVTATTAFQIRS